MEQSFTPSITLIANRRDDSSNYVCHIIVSVIFSASVVIRFGSMCGKQPQNYWPHFFEERRTKHQTANNYRGHCCQESRGGGYVLAHPAHRMDAGAANLDDTSNPRLQKLCHPPFQHF